MLDNSRLIFLTEKSEQFKAMTKIANDFSTETLVFGIWHNPVKHLNIFELVKQCRFRDWVYLTDLLPFHKRETFFPNCYKTNFSEKASSLIGPKYFLLEQNSSRKTGKTILTDLLPRSLLAGQTCPKVRFLTLWLNYTGFSAERSSFMRELRFSGKTS